MNADKYLVQITNINRIEEFKKLGVSNFLFALKDYSIGYKDFTFDDVKNLNINVYILCNRLLTDKDIDQFLKLKIPKNVKGFIIEEIGLFMELKGRGYTLINFQNHLNNNYKTINLNLKYYDSLMLNNDLTFDEMKKIIDNSNKKVCIRLFAREMVLYSRKKLITNYYDYYKTSKRDTHLNISLNGKNFIVCENEYGSCFFNKDVNDLREIYKNFNDKKILFCLIEEYLVDDFSLFLSGKKYDFTTDGFLNKKTIYKVGGDKNGTS